MVTLQKIEEEKLFYQVLSLKVDDTQKGFVATNTFSLAEAWYHSAIARPFAILAAGIPVGFFMGFVNHEKRDYGVWRLMIDKQYQGRGYGRAALALAIEYLRGEGADVVALSYEPENHVAAALYASMGFVLTGEVEDGEVVAKLTFQG